MNNVIHPLLAEAVLTLGEAAKSLPPIGGHTISVKSLYAWRTRGVRVGSDRVKLEACRLGGRWVTSAEALGRFLNTTTGTDENQPTIRTPTKRQKSSEEAVSFLQNELKQIKGPQKKRATPKRAADQKAA